MFFPILVLITALSISVVAAYYSIIGLTTLFSGAVLAVTIMGVVLEVGKIVTATWLHKNWKLSPLLLKIYLTIVVVVLMFITSMGIFGYLSKAHLTQAAPVSTLQTQLTKLDFQIDQEKQNILNEEKNISSSQRIIDQLDKSMESYFERGIISRALKEREKQKVEREREQKEIDESNGKIKQYNESISLLTTKKFDLEQQIKNVEIEVGPIKYIADLIYGEEKAKGLLEETVRFVILILIFVFDPLAVLLILAANISFKEYEKNKNNNKGILEVTKKAEETIEKYFHDSNLDKTYTQYNVDSLNTKEVNELIDKVLEPQILNEQTSKTSMDNNETVLVVPAIEAEKFNKLKTEISNQIDHLEKTSKNKFTNEDIELLTNKILNNFINDSQIPYNLNGDVGAQIKKIIKETILEQMNNSK